MEHISLYRKWRPQTFGDVVGQRHVTNTLANALSSGRLVHAYLFCGPRGTGKTSTARILAKITKAKSKSKDKKVARLEGRIKNFDRFAVIVEHNGADQMVLKHAIATIRTSRSSSRPNCGRGSSKTSICPWG